VVCEHPQHRDPTDPVQAEVAPGGGVARHAIFIGRKRCEV
jgi:hypothetical protein